MLSKLCCQHNLTTNMAIVSRISRLPSNFVASKRGLKWTTALNAVNYGRKAMGVGVRRAPTLREKLLGPTTGKPFVYGTYALAGGAAAGVAMMCYYGLGMSHELGAIHKAGMWPNYVRERLQNTYTYLGGSLLVTASSAVVAVRSPQIMRLVGSNSLLGLFGCLAAIVGTGMLVRSIDMENMGLKHGAWLLHCGVLGAVLAPMVFLGGPVLVRAAWYTAGIVGGLSLTAACAPSDKFLKWSAPLAMGLGVVFVSCIGTWFLPPTTALGAGLMSVAMYGGLLLFAAFLMYDTQRVIRAAEIHPPPYMNAAPFDPINAQMSLYLDILNIFIRLAMIMSGGGSRRK